MNSIKIYPKKKPAPVLLVYAISIFYIVIAVLMILCAVLNNIIFMFMSIALVACLVAINMCFSWYKSATLCKKNNEWRYEIEGIVSVVGHNETIYKIHSVKRYKVSEDTCQVWGNFECKENIGKYKYVNSFKILDVNDDVIRIINDICEKS